MGENYVIGDVENERPGVPLVGVIELKFWIDGKMKFIRPPDVGMALRMLEVAKAQLLGKDVKMESGIFVPDNGRKG